MPISQKAYAYIDGCQLESLDLLIELAQIPAPSSQEELRAKFCLNWLKEQGAADAYMDDALNVIYPIGVTDSNPLYVFMAHSDVVFPDTDPLPLRIDGNKLFCPGVGDDTANVVTLLMVAKYITANKLIPKDCGVLLVINSCEGLQEDLSGNCTVK